ncbi:MAG: hypothetical protein C0602_07550 [Denitrovibrio sp.]|nr:MAG: hypothetical protein C0602_07550 [Denitrovibrio sp.]
MTNINQKVNLLIVEDDRFTRKLYSEILKTIEKVTLHELETAENALEYIKDNKPDIVIMDYKLPGMNGLEATKQIIAAHPNTIVLSISGDNRNDLKDEMTGAGAVSFLKKPVRGKLLYHTILNFAEIVQTKKHLQKKPDLQIFKEAEEQAADSYESRPVKKAQNETFIENFENRDRMSEGLSMLSENSDTKNSEAFFEQLGNDSMHVNSFLESFNSLKNSVENLTAVVEADLFDEISDQFRKNSVRLNALLEFPTLVYTLTSISEFMDSHDIEYMSDIPMKKLSAFLVEFTQMYDSMVSSVFINKDASDIHDMDFALMSFGLQIDSIFSDLSVLAEDDETAIDEGGSIELF